MTTTKFIITENVKRLSELELETVELDYHNLDEENPFLSENLEQILTEKLEAKGWDVNDLKIFYSLGYCQGDGFMFEGSITTKEGCFKIKQSGHYFHQNSKTINVDYYIFGEDNLDEMDLTPEQEKIVENYEEEFNEEYKDLCREMEKIGYEIIEANNEESICRSAYEEWKTKNNVENNHELWDEAYIIKKPEKEKTKDYLLIGTSGNTSIELYLKDREVKIFDEVVNTNNTYRTKTIKEDEE